MAADEEETMKKTAVNATEGSHKCTKVMHVVSRKKKKIVPGKRRRSRRGMSSMEELAKLICRSGGEVERPVVFITGAGLSSSCGIRTFRGSTAVKAKNNGKRHSKRKYNDEDSEKTKGSAALWEEVVWSNSTRDRFRRDPLKWYNDFWLKYFPKDYNAYTPSKGHEAIAFISSLSENIDVRVITQNVDGLHSRTVCQWDYKSKLIEAHGLVGLYKCIPEEDSDTDSDSDIDEDRPVKLGSRRKAYAQVEDLAKVDESRRPCVYEFSKSMKSSDLFPLSVREILTNEQSSKGIKLQQPPQCHGCKRVNSVMPQALLFDEGYHSHSHYNFEKAENWISKASAIVFVGTSFAVGITNVALDFARSKQLPVFNFNLNDRLEPTQLLQAENIMGVSDETLPALAKLCSSFVKEDKDYIL